MNMSNLQSLRETLKEIIRHYHGNIAGINMNLKEFKRYRKDNNIEMDEKTKESLSQVYKDREWNKKQLKRFVKLQKAIREEMTKDVSIQALNRELAKLEQENVSE